MVYDERKPVKVFIICGNTAAGKTTYAEALAKELSAVTFSLDSWMQTLFSADYNPQTHSFNWLLERTERCKIQIRELAGQLIAKGVNIVLDLGFGDLKSRDFYREWAVSRGAEVSLHYLDVPFEERRKRVHKRNAEKGSTFAFEVTDEMFDYVDSMFEPPSDEELSNGKYIQS